MEINQSFADSAIDPAVKQQIEGYLNDKDLPLCNCNPSQKVCNGTKACLPNGGVYTKLDRDTVLEFDFGATLNNLNSRFDSILDKITEKKSFIADPPDPEDPDLEEETQKATDDIERLTQVLNELTYYTTQLKILLA